MEPRPLSFIARACAGQLRSGSPSTEVSRVCTDSRSVQSGDLFVALTGERFDGHQFVAEVVRKGAAAVLVQAHVSAEASKAAVGAAVVAVSDTRKALGLLSAEYRAQFALPVIAVGGSNGKTTTKELIASVLRQKLQVLSSEASFNNDIGVPLTLLRLGQGDQAAVVEVGTNHPGELEPLLTLARPQHGVLTSIGREHLEFFGNLEGVAKEEGFLAEAIPSEGTLFLNGDSEWTGPIVARCRANVARVGFKDGNQWRVRSLRSDTQGVTFQVEAPQAEFSGSYRVNLLGRHQAVNALFSVAVGATLGLSRAEIERGLEECKPSRMRLESLVVNGVRVIDDAYNSNADSAIASLQTLQDLPCKGRRVAVLGDMGELGQHSESLHEEVGRHAAELGVAQLFAVGRMAPVMARGAREHGLSRVLEFAAVEPAAEAVKKFVREGDVLLIKASRSMRLERVTELLRGTTGRGI
jgi:UDP-N-acetylmuramoyl-tripeptide--D-alanyl-D-alanine ligase